MIKNPVFHDIVCGRCGSNETRQLPAKWTEETITEYFPDWFFCCLCGGRIYLHEEGNKAC